MNKFIPVAEPSFLGNEKKYVMDCIDTTWISSNGKYIAEFEEKFAQYLGCKEAISCCNGTVALHLALMALGIGEGDEVLVPSLTYIATANAVRYCGATPVFVDCMKETWNIDINDATTKITVKTKCIIPVHLYGNPCDMDAVMEFAKKYNLYVIEDAAECHGATYRDKKTGTIGDIGTFSFFGNKIITTGEGGMAVTNNDHLAATMRILKGQGMDPERRYWFKNIGYNYRMTNVEAAIGLAQLEKIDEHISKRRKVAQWYMEELKEYEQYFTTQVVTRHAESVWWMFSVLLKESMDIDRDWLILKMREECNIETRPLFYPMHIMPPYYDEKAGCPVSEEIAARGLNLPTYGMLSKEDVKYICKSMISYMEQ